MNSESSRKKDRTLPHFGGGRIVESSDNEIKFAKLTRESNTAYRSMNTKPITLLHQPLWFWQKHSQWSYFKQGLFWGGIISFTAAFSAGCGVALTRINVVEKAIQRGLCERKCCFASSIFHSRGGGFPHERHSTPSECKVPKGRWRECAVQEAIAQGIKANSNLTGSLNQAVLSRPIDLLLIEVEPDTSSMVKFSSTSIGKTKAILVLQFDPDHGVAKIINIPTDSRVKIPGFGWGTIADAHRYGGVPLVSQVLTQLIEEVNINRYVRATPEVFQQLAASSELILDNCDSRIADCSNKVGQIIRQEDTLKAIHQHLNIPAYLANFQAAVTDIKPKLDTDLSLPELMSIANFVKDLDPENITASLLPEYVP
ncbi:LCP family protein [Pleurocapsa sp. FMAR1]|uniref:LCP family protein n=1 Tax=Pleurocapsa sp. FMAR1 TaxID=3040204 RepID=UPI0029C6FCB1|nr:LCP family protein [Pleurocapsa sp. FMAR1]